jgi:hypothetical protein
MMNDTQTTHRHRFRYIGMRELIASVYYLDLPFDDRMVRFSLYRCKCGREKRRTLGAKVGTYNIKETV